MTSAFMILKLFPDTPSLPCPDPTANSRLCSFVHSLIHSHLRSTYLVQVLYHAGGQQRTSQATPFSHGVSILVGESDAKPTTVQIAKLFPLCLGKGSHSVCDRQGEALFSCSLFLHSTYHLLDKDLIHLFDFVHLPPLECKLHMGRDLCLVLYPQCLKDYLAHIRC